MKASRFHDPGPKPTRYVGFSPGSWKPGLAGPGATTARHFRNSRTTTAAARRPRSTLAASASTRSAVTWVPSCSSRRTDSAASARPPDDAAASPAGSCAASFPDAAGRSRLPGSMIFDTGNDVTAAAGANPRELTETRRRVQSVPCTNMAMSNAAVMTPNVTNRQPRPVPAAADQATAVKTPASTTTRTQPGGSTVPVGFIGVVADSIAPHVTRVSTATATALATTLRAGRTLAAAKATPAVSPATGVANNGTRWLPTAKQNWSSCLAQSAMNAASLTATRSHSHAMNS